MFDIGAAWIRLPRAHVYVTTERQNHDHSLTISKAEETKNASTSTPKAMMTGVAISIGLGLLMVVTLIFTWGNALDADTDVPFIHLIHVATQNRAATTALVLLIATPILGSVVACCATASRQVWAMARDNGLPCSGLIKRVGRI